MAKICSINVLGEPWEVHVVGYKEDKWFKKNKSAGGCFEDSKVIKLLDPFTDTRVEYESFIGALKVTKVLLRHEVIHAFLVESGLDANSHIFGGAWCENEEMVEWFAAQWEKIDRQVEFAFERVRKKLEEKEDGSSQT